MQVVKWSNLFAALLTHPFEPFPSLCLQASVGVLILAQPAAFTVTFPASVGAHQPFRAKEKNMEKKDRTLLHSSDNSAQGLITSSITKVLMQLVRSV